MGYQHSSEYYDGKRPCGIVNGLLGDNDTRRRANEPYSFGGRVWVLRKCAVLPGGTRRMASSTSTRTVVGVPRRLVVRFFPAATDVIRYGRVETTQEKRGRYLSRLRAMLLRCDGDSSRRR